MATKQVRKPGRPAKKTRRTFAAGGVIRLAQGEKVPKPEEEALLPRPAERYPGVVRFSEQERGLAEAERGIPGVATYPEVGPLPKWSADMEVKRDYMYRPREAAPAAVASPGLAPPPGPTLTSAMTGAPPAAGAVPAAPPGRRGPSRQQGAELTQQYNPREVGQYGATTVYQRDVPEAEQDEYGKMMLSDSARGATKAGFDQDLRQYGAGISQPGGAVGAVSAADRLTGQRAEADNALLQKWYSMPENQRGRMPASVENAKYRGADDTETAFNVARARIMETRMDPGRQAQALANLDKTRADMLNQSQQTRQTGEYQQGQLGNERERTGVARQQVEQTGQNQQAQMAHQQRMAQLALDQGVAEGALLPDEEYQKDRALDDSYNAAFEQRRTIRERARRILMGRMMKGETLQDVLANPGTDDERAMLSTIINPSVAMRPKQYAGGGMVSPQPPVYGGAPDAQRADPLINAYRIYTTQSKAMGAPAVPFAEFSSLYAGATQGPMQPPVGMAGGGAVPAAGKMVIDTDPNARVDSIPAMIDGEQPAALNSGEFVFPTDVTNYYGTKMLSGMIEKARQGANGSKPSG